MSIQAYTCFRNIRTCLEIHTCFRNKRNLPLIKNEIQYIVLSTLSL